jgi:hypothetical protein
MRKFFFLTLFFPGIALAEFKEGVYASAGMFFQNMFKVSCGPCASRSAVGEVYLPELVVGYRTKNLLPTLAVTISGNKANDGDMQRSTVRLDLPYLFPHNESIEWKAGLGYLVYRLKSDGATVTLRNGSSTSTFYVPAGTISGSQFYVMGGMGYLLEKGIRFDLDVILGNLLTTKRTLNFSLRGGYVF